MTAQILHYADVENAYDTPERVGRLAGAITTLHDDATVLTGGGDNTAPGVLSLVCDGEQAQDFYKAVKPVVDVYGNHDFDNGFDAARRTAREFPGTWLNANAILNGDRFAAAATTPTTIVEAGDTPSALSASPPIPSPKSILKQTRLPSATPSGPSSPPKPTSGIQARTTGSWFLIVITTTTSRARPLSTQSLAATNTTNESPV